MKDRKYKSEYSLAYYHKHKEKRKAYNNLPHVKKKREIYGNSSKRKQMIKNGDLIRNFNITLDDYNKIFVDQEGCCAICKSHQSEFKLSLSVDHCHETGKIRGLLCGNCNMALGLLKDNILNLEEAIKYLSLKQWFKHNVTNPFE